MFENIGEKCKKVAKINCVVGMLAFVISGIVVIISGNLLSGLLMAILGSVAAYLSSIGLYAIGEAAENSAIAANLAIKADHENHKTEAQE